jgi:hypothetical protein
MAKSKSQKKQSKQQKQQGGEGAADHALKVYGGVNEQRAVSDIDNTIATNGQGVASVGAPVADAPSMKGGFWPFTSDANAVVVAEKKPLMVNGENGMVNGENGMALKTDPLVGGKQSKQQLQKTIMKQLKQLKQQGGSLGFSEYSSSPQPVVEGNTDMPIVPDAAVPSGQQGGQGQQKFDLLKGFTKAGDKLSKQQLQSLNQQLDKVQKQQQQGGVGLNEIVVPLVLLYASQKYAEGKTVKKGGIGLNEVAAPLVLLYASQKYAEGKTVKKGGVGLNEVVVPLVLLYSSQKYAQGKTAKKTVKPMSKAMRSSRRFTK